MNRRQLPRPNETHLTRYEPADSYETPRFSDVRTFMRLRNTRDLLNADAAIVGAPFDTGATFRAGAALALKEYAASPTS